MTHDTSPVWVQGTYAFRNDDGNLSGASWKGGEGGTFIIPENKVFRLRTILGESANQTTSTPYAPQLQFKRNGGSWTTVGAATDLQYAASADTSWTLTDGDTEATDRLSLPTGVTNRYGTNYYDENNSTTGIALANQAMEIEYCLKVKSGLTGGNSAHSISNSAYLGLSFATGVASPVELLVVDKGAKILILDATDLYLFEGQPGDASSFKQTAVLALDAGGLNLTAAAVGMCAKPDGTEMFILSSDGTIDRISMSTGWDIANATDPSDGVDISTPLTNEGGGTPTGIDCKPDGTVIIVSDKGSDKVHQFSGTAWDISTFTTDNLQVAVNLESSNPETVRYNSDGTKILVNDLAGDAIYQYSIASAYSFNGTNSYDSVSLSVASEEGNMTGMDWDDDGDYLYIIGNANDTVYQYNSGAEHFQLRLNDSTEGVCDTILFTPHIKVEAVGTDNTPVIKSSSSTSGTTTSLSLTPPSGIVDDDILVLAVGSDYSSTGDVTYTKPTGFNDIGTYQRAEKTTGGAGSSLQLFWKKAASESGNYTIGISSSQLTHACMIRIDGADLTTPIDDYQFLIHELDTSTLDFRAPSANPSVIDTLAVLMGTWDESKTLNAAPRSFREQEHLDASGLDGYVAFREWASLSPIGLAEADISSATSWVGAMLIIQPPQSSNATGTVAFTEANDTVASSGSEKFTGTASFTEANDTVASSGIEEFTGTIAFTEADDTVASSGSMLITGTVSFTEADDTIASSGSVLNPVSGTVSFTEVDDTVASSGSMLITGTASFTETDDTVASSGYMKPVGTVAFTEIDDTVASSGIEEFTGTAAFTEEDDSSAAAGSEEFTGTIAFTEADDTVASSGSMLITGTASFTEADDTVASSGASANNVGSIAFTEADDTIASSGYMKPVGTVAFTEANDTIASSGSMLITGTVSFTEADDTVVSSGSMLITGTASFTEADDTVAASGTAGAGSSVTGTAAFTEADDTVASSGIEEFTGTASFTEADDTVGASDGFILTDPDTGDILTDPDTGDVLTTPFSSDITATVAFTEEDDTVAAGGSAYSISGTVAFTEEDDIVLSLGVGFLLTGTAAFTEEDDIVTSSGLITVIGTSSYTEADDTVAAGGFGNHVFGTSAFTEEDDTVLSLATLTLYNTGTIAFTEEDDIVSAASIAEFTGTVAFTEADDTIISSGLMTVVGTSSYTEADDIVASSGSMLITGTSAFTETNDTVDSLGIQGPVHTGFIFITEADDTVASSGIEEFTGAIAFTEANDRILSLADQIIIGDVAFTEEDDIVASSNIYIYGPIIATEDSDNIVVEGKRYILEKVYAGSALVTSAYHGTVPVYKLYLGDTLLVDPGDVSEIGTPEGDTLTTPEGDTLIFS